MLVLVLWSLNEVRFMPSQTSSMSLLLVLMWLLLGVRCEKCEGFVVEGERALWFGLFLLWQLVVVDVDDSICLLGWGMFVWKMK